MSREIGSEFSWEESGKLSEVGQPAWLRDAHWQLVFSGRTAIEAVIRDRKEIRTALLPSYCCDSMIEPFRAAGIAVSFYPVWYEDGLRAEVGEPDGYDAVLWCNYFGFRSRYPEELFREYRHRGGIVIEDVTHSLLSEDVCHEVDYCVASVRKWGPLISGGLCCKFGGTFREKVQGKPSQWYVETKSRAMDRKMQYLDAPMGIDKEEFLSLFSQSNYWLAENYSGRRIDSVSERLLRGWDRDRIRQCRRENARVLLEHLGQEGLPKPLFSMDQMDCPLFVPVIIQARQRGEIRNRLTENGIYCPIHWPRPKESSGSNLYETELSLVCDQRYAREDMQRIINVLRG